MSNPDSGSPQVRPSLVLLEVLSPKTGGVVARLATAPAAALLCGLSTVSRSGTWLFCFQIVHTAQACMYKNGAFCCVVIAGLSSAAQLILAEAGR